MDFGLHAFMNILSITLIIFYHVFNLNRKFVNIFLLKDKICVKKGKFC